MLAGALITASRLDLEIKVDKEPIAQPSASFRFPNGLSCPQFILGSGIAANGMTDRVASNGASLDESLLKLVSVYHRLPNLVLRTLHARYKIEG